MTLIALCFKRIRNKKVEWAGKTDIKKVELLSVGEAGKAIFWSVPGLEE